MKKPRIELMTPLYLAISAHTQGLREKNKDPLKGVDLLTEYKLIKNKESRLSSNLRKLVVSRYEDGER